MYVVCAVPPLLNLSCSGSSSDNSDEESDIIPGRWGLAILDGRIIVTKPALDSVPAVPMCLSPPDASQSNDVDLLQASLLISKIKVRYLVYASVYPKTQTSGGFQCRSWGHTDDSDTHRLGRPEAPIESFGDSRRSLQSRILV